MLLFSFNETAIIAKVAGLWAIALLSAARNVVVLTPRGGQRTHQFGKVDVAQDNLAETTDRNPSNSTYFDSWTDAILFEEKTLDRAIEMMRKFGEKVDVVATYADNIVVEHDDVENCNRIQNSRSFSISKLEIRAGKVLSHNLRHYGFSIKFANRNFETVGANGSGPLDEIRMFSQEVRMLRQDIRPWYSFISKHAPWIALSAVALPILGATVYVDFLPQEPSVQVESKEGLRTANLVLIVLSFLLVFALEKVLKILFPRVLFATDEKKSIKRSLENWRIGITTAVILPLLIGIAFN